MIIVVRSVFHDGNKYYPQFLLDECLYKLKMLEYDRNDIDKASGQRKCIICHYWYFLEISFISQPKVCGGFSKNHNHYYLKNFSKKFE